MIIFNTVMKISLVMAVYNGEKYLFGQLDSLRNQTRKIDEVIIVDDCSKDKSGEIINNYIEKFNLTHWKYILNKNNIGYKKNFKKGLANTSGDIIFLCDQDDIWYNNKIEIMSDIMRSKNILTLASSFNFINKEGKIFKVKTKYGSSNNNLLKMKVDNELTEINLNILLKTNFSQGCTMALKKQIKKEFLDYSENLYPHDWEINLLAAIHHGCYYLDKKLVYYRIHDDNTIGLDSIIGANILDNKSSRINNRVKLTIGEIKISEFVLYSKNLSTKDRLICKRYHNYLNNRIQYLTNKDIMGLVSYFFKGGYKEFGHFKTVIGDIVAVIL